LTDEIILYWRQFVHS